MKKQSAAPAAPAPEFPRITTSELVERFDANSRADLLSDEMREAMEFYFTSYNRYLIAHEKLAYLERDKHLFHGARKVAHPMSWQRWASSREEGTTMAQLERALKARDWQEAMMCAGMLCVREMIYGRPAEVKAAPAAKANAARKVAKSRPAAKKPELPKRSGSAAPRNKTRNIPTPKKPLATLTEIVAQAKPLFKANPGINREQLFAKIGRRYERLTTFAELKTLCAGKTPTQHSLKQAVRKEKAAVKDTLLEMTRAVSAPQPPAPPAGVETVGWPKPDANGLYSRDQAQHVADFASGAVKCDFAVINTEDGWTYGMRLLIDGTEIEVNGPLQHLGPVTLDADTAIRDACVTLLAEVSPIQDQAADPSIAPHLADLEKLRAWLLGFQARGVEKIEFLRKQHGRLEFAV